MLERITRWLSNNSPAMPFTIDLVPLLEQWNEQRYLVLLRIVPQELLTIETSDTTMALS